MYLLRVLLLATWSICLTFHDIQLGEFSAVDALSTTTSTGTTSTTRNVAKKSGSFTKHNNITPSSRIETTTMSPFLPNESSPSQEYYRQEEEDELLGYSEVSSFQELQRSMGSEILDDELQQQIEQATVNVDLFLEVYQEKDTTEGAGGATSVMEKVAMSSIPEQLPQPAVNALLLAKQQQKSTKTRTKSNVLHRSNAQRLTLEEELELATLIQKGVKLHKLKSDYEEKHASKLSKHDWAALAGLESATALRREVATYRRAKQLLVTANVGLVHAVVKKKFRALRHTKICVTYEEVVQEASLGLIRAAELFDPSRGLRFSTYAAIWIKGVLSMMHITEPIYLPARERSKWKKIEQAHDELVKEKGWVNAQPTTTEVARRVGMTVNDVMVIQHKMSQVKSVLSLDYEYQKQSRSGEQQGKSEYVLENDKNFQYDVDLAERTQMQADVIAAMARSLNPREARLIRLRYGLTDGQTRSLQECAEAMGLTKSLVQKLNVKCLRKLREAAEAESLEEYLLTIA